MQKKLGFDKLLNSNMLSENKKSVNSKVVVKEEYRRALIKYLELNPKSNRTELRNDLKKEYIWLYRNDNEWLLNNLPKPKNNVKTLKSKVDWNKRDQLIVDALKNEHKNIINNNEMKRISKSMLGRRIGKLALVEKELGKLPHTKKILEDICENTEEFQLRRVEKVCEDLIKNKEDLSKWKIIRAAGLRNSNNPKINKKINEIVNRNGECI